MRSLLLVPADNERKLSRAPECGADVVILDLEDAVATDRKELARQGAVEFLRSRAASGPKIYVRVNGLKSGLIESDLDAIIPAHPDALMLPKADSGSDIALLSAMIAAREALAGLDDGAIRILASVAESVGAIFNLATYKGASSRLAGLAWCPEKLAAALGAKKAYDDRDRPTDPLRIARSLCLYSAVHAAVPAIDRVFPDFCDSEALRAEAAVAARDGFAAKLAAHPSQVTVINDVLAPNRPSI